MLRPALILALGLVTSASADLWTSQPLASAPSTTPPTTSAPLNRADGPASSADATAVGRPSLTVIVDPACSVTAQTVEDAAVFARAHGDIAVRVILTGAPRQARQSLRTLIEAAQNGLDLAWVPAEVRRRAPAALPAVYLDDGQGHGVRATGRPPLDVLWRRVRTGAGR
jgi:hypothetical protein